MKKIVHIKPTVLLFLFAICFLISIQAISQNWEWAKKISSKATNAGYAVATDKNGNIYVTGSFSDTLHIDGAFLISKGLCDIFLAKFNFKGNLLWLKQAGGEDMDEAYGIAIDKDDNVYITGYISGRAEFSGKFVTGSTNRDFFLTKYDTDGNVLWVNLEEGLNEDYGKSVCVDKNGDVYATGIFHGTIKAEKTILVSKSAKNTFIIKHDKNGNFLWAKTGTSTGSNEASEINIDRDGNVFVAGTFEGTAEFDKKVLVSSNNKEVFIVKYNSKGDIQWLKKGGSTSKENSLNAIATDSTGNIFITGFFTGTAFFGNNQLKSSGSKDIFLVKYSNKGDIVWAKQTGGKGDEIAQSMEVDKDGNIFIAGEFNFTFPFAKSNLKNSGDWDILVLKYNKDGEMIYGSQIGGSGYNKATGISVDNNGGISLIGYFSQKSSFGQISLEANQKEGAGFVARYQGLGEK